MTDQRRLEVPSVGPARCHGSGSYEDGKFYWREGCDDCQRRVAWTREALITPPPIIAFECEYRIGPDEIVAQVSPMTDLTPNDLSHLSDEEFLALCPQGEHAPGPEPLSPAAQKVLDVLRKELDYAPIRQAGAAALRALADQLRLEMPLGDTDADAGVFAAHHAIYAAILAIATELEGTND